MTDAEYDATLYRDLLDAVVDALDVPAPATVGDESTYRRVVADRAMEACTAVRAALADDVPVPHRAAYLRDRLAAQPVDGYQHWQETGA